MGYLVRKADAFLREWKKNPDRKPLIIKGARQVGKQRRSEHLRGKIIKM